MDLADPPLFGEGAQVSTDRLARNAKQRRQLFDGHALAVSDHVHDAFMALENSHVFKSQPRQGAGPSLTEWSFAPYKWSMGFEPLPQRIDPSPRSGRSAISASRSFDVAVIGGGVVGCATARAFALAGATVVLIEKAADILAGASKANSALLHTGFDAPAGSLELRLMQRGYAAYMAIRERLTLPLLETGALVAAWTDEDVAGLDVIERRARENGVETVRRLSRAEALAREPELSKTLKAALLVPGEHVIDAWSAPLAYIHQAVANGASVMFNSEVTGGAFDGERWRLRTAAGDVEARHAVNCARPLRGCLGSPAPWRFELHDQTAQGAVRGLRQAGGGASDDDNSPRAERDH